MKKAAASRAVWLRDIAEKKGYTLERDDGGRYVLRRDGLSMRYSFAACLEALTTGKGLPEHTARPHALRPIVEDRTNDPTEVKEYTLTPGEALSGGGWWLSDGRFAVWKPTHGHATAAIESGEFDSRIPKRSDAY